MTVEIILKISASLQGNGCLTHPMFDSFDFYSTVVSVEISTLELDGVGSVELFG